MNAQQLVENYYENLWNNQDKKFIDILLDENLVFRGSLGTEVVGKKGFEEYFDMIIKAIPNLYHAIETIVVENNHVAVRAVYNGTHKGKLLDFEPTNNRIKYNGASFFTIENNKIKEIWVLGDLNALTKQLTSK